MPSLPSIAALFPALLESELFGHMNSFTGCGEQGRLVRDRQRRNDFPGRNRRHDAGHPGQVAGAIQEREFRRVGGTQDMKVDAWSRRPTAISKRPSQRIVQKICITVWMSFPSAFPASLRAGDIPLLVAHFLEKFA
jgi:two-component system response regulator PilR (NtrC family)